VPALARASSRPAARRAMTGSPHAVWKNDGSPPDRIPTLLTLRFNNSLLIPSGPKDLCNTHPARRPFFLCSWRQPSASDPQSFDPIANTSRLFCFPHWSAIDIARQIGHASRENRQTLCAGF
jgi:hypothetical protein